MFQVTPVHNANTRTGSEASRRVAEFHPLEGHKTRPLQNTRAFLNDYYVVREAWIVLLLEPNIDNKRDLVSLIERAYVPHSLTPPHLL